LNLVVSIVHFPRPAAITSATAAADLSLMARFGIVVFLELALAYAFGLWLTKGLRAAVNLPAKEGVTVIFVAFLSAFVSWFNVRWLLIASPLPRVGAQWQLPWLGFLYLLLGMSLSCFLACYFYTHHFEQANTTFPLRRAFLKQIVSFLLVTGMAVVYELSSF
jgi:hypothetical protein